MALIISSIENKKCEELKITIPFKDFEYLLIQYNSLLASYYKCHEEGIVSPWNEPRLEEAFNINLDHYEDRKEELWG